MGKITDGDTIELATATAGEDYKKMCALLYAYRFGTIEFLELLDRFEKILHIKSPQTTCQNAPDTKQ